MGRTHAAKIAKIEGVDLSAVCDKSKDAAGKLAQRIGPNAKIYTDFSEMLDRERLDALYVCLPPFAHAGEVEKAAERGIHLFLEKPIAINSIKAEIMLDAINRAGVRSQVGFHMRFRKSVRRIRELAKSGAVGRPVLFTGRFWTNMDGPEWWRDKAKSGGQIFEQAIHIYDMARFLFGDVGEAAGMLDNLCHRESSGYGMEDVSTGSMRFANGAMGIVTSCNCAVPMHFFADFRAVFSRATLDYSCGGQSWVSPDKAAIYIGEKEREDFVEDGDPYFDESLDFINAVRENRKTLCPAEEGLEAIRLVEKITEEKKR